MNKQKQIKKVNTGKKAVKPAPVQKTKNGPARYFLPVALIAFAFVAFYPSLSNGFTNWDDPTYIIYNSLIKNFAFENVKRIFTQVYFSNYQPLHLFSYLIEYHFFGLDASGYHWVSLIMHCVNILLVLWIAKLFTKNNYVAFFTALFFAITPMRVESVAWAAERKDLLYSMFFFAAFICYIFYLRRKLKIKYILLTFLFYTLSTFSKTMAVSLVPVLFLTDYFENRKISFKVILEKVPFVLLALVMGIISVKASYETQSIDTSTQFSFLDRLFFASQNILMYVSKCIFPYGLTSYYPYPNLENGHIPASYYFSGVVIIMITVLVLLSLKKGKMIFYSTGFFVSTVALVLMILPVGPTIFSERYSYIPSVMLYFTLLFYLFKWVESTKSQSFLNATSVALIAFSLYFVQVTRQRCLVWKDSLVLWSDVIKTNPVNPHALNNRGFEWKQRGEFKSAITDYMQAIALKPDFPEPYAGLCDVYGNMSMFDSAMYYANRALALKPDMSQALNNRGIVRAKNHNLDSALMDFNAAIKVKPDMFEVYGNRGNLNCTMGNLDAGLDDFNMALKVNPDFSDGYKNKGILLGKRKDYEGAIYNLKMYFQKGGKDARMYLFIANLYADQKDYGNAISYARMALNNGLPEANDLINRWSAMK
jgi:lipoprotein NlpI